MSTYDTAEKVEAIEAVLKKLREGRQKNDPKLAASVFAEDADWMNAFGVRRRGRAEIEAWYARLFRDPGMQNIQIRSASPTAIRFVRSDVAVAHRQQESVGQRTPSGQKVDTRKTHHVSVLSKEEDGWVIVSYYIMDERPPLR